MTCGSDVADRTDIAGGINFTPGSVTAGERVSDGGNDIVVVCVTSDESDMVGGSGMSGGSGEEDGSDVAGGSDVSAGVSGAHDSVSRLWPWASWLRCWNSRRLRALTSL